MILAVKVKPVEILNEYRIGWSFDRMARIRNTKVSSIKRIVFDRIQADDIDERTVHLLNQAMAAGDI